MAQTEEFQKWVRIEASKRTGELERIKQEVDKQMRKVKVEIHDDKGRWIEWEDEQN